MVFANLASVRNLILFQTLVVRVQKVLTVVRLEGGIFEQGCAHVCDQLQLAVVLVRVSWLVVQIAINVKTRIPEHGLLKASSDCLVVEIQPVVLRIDVTRALERVPDALFNRTWVIREYADQLVDAVVPKCDLTRFRVLLVVGTHAAPLVKKSHKSEERLRWGGRHFREALHLEG